MIKRKRGLSVLVADDHPDLRSAVERYLAACGHTVHAAADGVQAWRLFQSLLPDVVITDLDMPGMDGWALLAKICSAHPETPVLVMSGCAPEDAGQDARLRGARAFLAKPFPFDELTRTVEAVADRAVTAGV